MNNSIDSGIALRPGNCNKDSSSFPMTATADENSLEGQNSNSSEENSLTSQDSAVPNYCRVLKFTDDKGNVKELLFPKNLDLDRPKRSRTNFTNHQLKSLEKAFAKNQYLVGKERKALSKELDLSEAQIKVWYQNRRTKHKREQSKEKERLEANRESLATTSIMKILESHHRQPAMNKPPELSAVALVNGLERSKQLDSRFFLGHPQTTASYYLNKDLMAQFFQSQ